MHAEHLFDRGVLYSAIEDTAAGYGSELVFLAELAIQRGLAMPKVKDQLGIYLDAIYKAFGAILQERNANRACTHFFKVVAIYNTGDHEAARGLCSRCVEKLEIVLYEAQRPFIELSTIDEMRAKAVKCQAEYLRPLAKCGINLYKSIAAWRDKNTAKEPYLKASYISFTDLKLLNPARYTTAASKGTLLEIRKEFFKNRRQRDGAIQYKTDRHAHPVSVFGERAGKEETWFHIIDNTIGSLNNN